MAMYQHEHGTNDGANEGGYPENMHAELGKCCHGRGCQNDGSYVHEVTWERCPGYLCIWATVGSCMSVRQYTATCFVQARPRRTRLPQLSRRSYGHMGVHWMTGMISFVPTWTCH